MHALVSIGALALAAVLSIHWTSARAAGAGQYPDLKGQWRGAGGGEPPQWDPTKPPGPGQQAPLTPEYQAIFEATLARRAARGQSGPPPSCLPPGMPQSMIGYEPIEIIVFPDTTFMMISFRNEFRRIFTDGRPWPAEIEPSYAGFSIGAWQDSDGDGRYDTLAVETRALKGPRTFDRSGLPLHKDNETVVKERIFLDRSEPNLLHDEITTIDHALTRPWTVTRSYRRAPQAVWLEHVCSENNHRVLLGEESYLVDEDGFIKPTRPGQPAPDLKYFGGRK
jgi:hypothetical protein